MKSYVLFWAFLLWLPFQLLSQNTNYRVEIEVLIADENSDLFIPLQTYSYSLAPQSYRQNMVLPATAGRIRLQMYLMSGMNKVDIYDLLVNGVKSSDQESFVIENPLAWIQRNEPLMIVLADKPYSYYKLNAPIQWSNVTERTPGLQAYSATPAPQAYNAYAPPPATAPAGYGKTYVQPGFAIQIEARKDLPTLEKFTALLPFGTVYYREDPNWYRVRVGSFTSREEALEKRDAIRRLQGGAFNKAFLITEEGGYVVQLSTTTVPATAGTAPQSYDNLYGGRIATTPAPATAEMTAKGAVAAPAPAQPQSYSAPSRPSTLAERAPRFPDWYYQSPTTAATAQEPEPTNYEAIINSPLPKGYDTAGGNLTPKGVSQPGYYVQTGAFGNYENAERNRQKLLSLGITNARVIEARKDDGEIIYRTWIGPYRTQATANNQKELMAKNLKISGTVVTN